MPINTANMRAVHLIDVFHSTAFLVRSRSGSGSPDPSTAGFYFATNIATLCALTIAFLRQQRKLLAVLSRIAATTARCPPGETTPARQSVELELQVAAIGIGDEV